MFRAIDCGVGEVGMVEQFRTVELRASSLILLDESSKNSSFSRVLSTVRDLFEEVLSCVQRIEIL